MVDYGGFIFIEHHLFNENSMEIFLSMEQIFFKPSADLQWNLLSLGTVVQWHCCSRPVGSDNNDIERQYLGKKFSLKVGAW